MYWGLLLVCWGEPTFNPLSLISLFSSSLCPWGSVPPHTASCIFPHHYCSALTCLPLLYFTPLPPARLRCVMFLLWHLLLMVPWPQNQGKREHLPHCFSWGRKVESTGRLWLVMVMEPGVQSFHPFAEAAWQKCIPFQALSSSWASLWTCSCWESAPLLMCWVLMQRAWLTGECGICHLFKGYYLIGT